MVVLKSGALGMSHAHIVVHSTLHYRYSAVISYAVKTKVKCIVLLQHRIMNI